MLSCCRAPVACVDLLQGVHFYGSSIPKSSSYGIGGHSYSRNRRHDGLSGTSPPNGGAVGWLMGATPPDGNGLYGTSPSGSMASSFGAGSYKQRHMAAAGGLLGSSPGGAGRPGSSLPLPKFQHPSHALLEENGFKQIKYMKWFKRCIEDRAAKGGLEVGRAARAAGARLRLRQTQYLNV